VGAKNPVVQVIDEANGEVVYTIRVLGESFRPKVFKQGTYTLKIGEEKLRQTIKGLKAEAADDPSVLEIKLN
jgi:hypothetical protein